MIDDVALCLIQLPADVLLSKLNCILELLDYNKTAKIVYDQKRQ